MSCLGWVQLRLNKPTYGRFMVYPPMNNQSTVTMQSVSLNTFSISKQPALGKKVNLVNKTCLSRFELDWGREVCSQVTRTSWCDHTASTSVLMCLSVCVRLIQPSDSQPRSRLHAKSLITYSFTDDFTIRITTSNYIYNKKYIYRFPYWK